MVDRGVKLLTNREEWERISNYARKYAEDNWSFNACKKIFTSKLEPLLQKVNNINKLDI